MNKNRRKKTTKASTNNHGGKKLNMKKVRLFIILPLLIIFIFLIRNGSTEKLNDKLRILYNNELVEYSKEPIIEDNKIFLSKDDVMNVFDKTIYYNSAEKELITTFNKHIALLKVDEEYMVLNDSTIKIESSLKDEDGEIYLPMNELKTVYDIELAYSSENKTIMMDSTSKEKKTAAIVKNTTLKEKDSFLSKGIEKIKEGSEVVVIEETPKYLKVRTDKGNIGYIKTKKASEIKKIRDNYDEEKDDLNYLDKYSDVKKAYEDLKVDVKKYNVVAPKLYTLENTSLVDKTSYEEVASYRAWADANNLNVIPMLDLGGTVSKTIITYAQRNKVINDLYVSLVNGGYRGVVINFENIDDINSFYRFLIEITPKFKESGMKVIVKYNSNMDKDKVKEIVDYVV